MDNTTYGYKSFSIPLFVVVLIVIIIAYSSSTIYSFYFGDNKTNDDIVLSESTNNDNEIIFNNTKMEEVEEIQELPADSPQVYTYTASNGKNYDAIGVLKIPNLNIEYPILADTSDELLKVSITKYWGPNPNEVGNLCILGHNYKNSKFFGNLLNIQKSELIQITDVTGNTLNYKVYDFFVVNPDDTSCTSQLTDGNTEITLITCYYEKGYTHSTKRFIVKARAFY